MRIFGALWLYFQLVLANATFFIWFTWQRYCTSRVLLISLSWLLLACLLCLNQLLGWTQRTSPTLPDWFQTQSPTTLNSAITWRALTPGQLSQYCQQLTGWLGKQPNHRQLLLNSAFCAAAKKNQPQSLDFWAKAKALDPNDPWFAQK
jgi:hypothetical protein